MDDTTIAAALAAIDARHAEDPNGRELDYAERMTHWLRQLTATPSPELRVAVRAQHFERWTTPRGAFPEGRRGYLEWRRNAAGVQAQKVADLLDTIGCPAPSRDRVAALVRKENLRSDPETQHLEDCACLAFIESRLDAFARHREPEQLRRVVGQTWRKMSPRARDLARALPAAGRHGDLLRGLP